MNQLWVALVGWVFAAIFAVMCGVLVVQLRAEHIKGKLASALAGSGPQLPEIPFDWPQNVQRIVLVGDSRIAQWPRPEAPQGYHIISRGRGGETSLQLEARMPDLLKALNPDVVVIGTGANDLVAASLSAPHAERIEESLLASVTRITDRIRRAGAEPVLSTIIQPARADFLRRALAWNMEIHDMVARVNAAFLAQGAAGLRVFDANAVLKGGAGPLAAQFSKDTLHLNKIAYALLSQALMQEIIQP